MSTEHTADRGEPSVDEAPVAQGGSRHSLALLADGASAQARLLAALTAAGAAIEDLPRDEYRAAVSQYVTGSTDWHEKLSRYPGALDFLIGTFLAAHHHRLALNVAIAAQSMSEKEQGHARSLVESGLVPDEQTADRVLAHLSERLLDKAEERS